MTDIALPVGWTHAPLSELLLGIEAGKSFKCEERPPIGDEIGVVKVSAVTWGEYREPESKTCTEAGRVNPALFVRPGDFLFSRANTIDLVGACVIAGQVTQRIMLSDKILRLQFIDDRQKPWVLQFLRSQDGRDQIKELSTGNQESMRNIGQERIGQIRVPVPPEAERERIVEKLEELLSDLEAGVAELMAAQRKLAQYRQSLLKAAMEGALTADWRGDSPVDGELPEGWLRTTIGTLGKVQLGRQRSPDKLKGINPTKYIRAANITEDGINFDDVLEMDFSETERENFSLRENDVLLTEASGSVEHVGRPVIWPAVKGLYCFQNTVLRFVPNGVSAEFAFYSFLAMQKTGVFRRLSAGVGINHLSAGKFSKLPFALPPKEEQRQIIALLETRLEAVKEQQAAIERGLAQAAAQRKNILKAAFAGQLVPQDPNDEPASELLARIRAERSAESTTTTRKRGRKAKESA